MEHGTGRHWGCQKYLILRFWLCPKKQGIYQSQKKESLSSTKTRKGCEQGWKKFYPDKNFVKKTPKNLVFFYLFGGLCLLSLAPNRDFFVNWDICSLLLKNVRHCLY